MGLGSEQWGLSSPASCTFLSALRPGKNTYIINVLWGPQERTAACSQADWLLLGIKPGRPGRMGGVLPFTPLAWLGLMAPTRGGMPSAAPSRPWHRGRPNTSLGRDPCSTSTYHRRVDDRPLLNLRPRHFTRLRIVTNRLSAHAGIGMVLPRTPTLFKQPLLGAGGLL